MTACMRNADKQGRKKPAVKHFLLHKLGPFSIRLGIVVSHWNTKLCTLSLRWRKAGKKRFVSRDAMPVKYLWFTQNCCWNIERWCFIIELYSLRRKRGKEYHNLSELMQQMMLSHWRECELLVCWNINTLLFFCRVDFKNILHLVLDVAS